MANLVEVKVPDIGDFKDVAVIELLVKPGEVIAVDTALIMVESDKASMEIPSSHAGTVKELKVKLGDKVSEGSVILVVEAAGAAAAAPAEAPAAAKPPRRPRHRAVPVADAGADGAAASPARPTSNARCSCSAPALAAIRPPSAAPTSA